MVTLQRVRSVATDLVSAAALMVMKVVQLTLSHRCEERRRS